MICPACIGGLHPGNNCIDGVWYCKHTKPAGCSVTAKPLSPPPDPRDEELARLREALRSANVNLCSLLPGGFDEKPHKWPERLNSADECELSDALLTIRAALKPRTEK